MTDTTALTPEVRSWLLDLARTTIRRALEGGGLVLPEPTGVPPVAADPGAAFVTLRREGRLLGCIGSMEAHRSLAEDVAAHAFDAAFRDPRLPAVTEQDWHLMVTEISVLGPLEGLEVTDRTQLVSVLRAHVDGVLLTSREGRGTFLPAVWHQVRDHEEFVELLWRKAGLREGSWPSDLVIERYEVIEFDDARSV